MGKDILMIVGDFGEDYEMWSFFDRARGKRVEDRLLEECGIPVTIVPR